LSFTPITEGTLQNGQKVAIGNHVLFESPWPSQNGWGEVVGLMGYGDGKIGEVKYRRDNTTQRSLPNYIRKVRRGGVEFDVPKPKTINKADAT
jgi:hypothetical protein